MSYKTILVHVDESSHAAERIAVAARIASAEDAHLIGAAATGISRFVFSTVADDQIDPSLLLHLGFLRERANRALTDFEAMAQNAGVRSIEKRLIEDDAADGISLQARYSDLAVISQIDPDEPSPGVMSEFPEYVVMNSARPVLLVPYAGHFDRIGERVLVAWDASIEATRAVTQAIPLLKKAKAVEVAIFNAVSIEAEPEQQAETDIARYLARHGINVKVSHHVATIDIGNALLSLAADLTSDLIVMGGYGHSRFREILLGGVTRTVLQSMTVPVLMAH
jgi:nucleotide-binding universal stress UspA family protein